MIRLTPGECRALLRETIRLAQENAGRPQVGCTLAGRPVYQGYLNGRIPGSYVIDATTREEVVECDELGDESSSGDSSVDWRRFLSDLV